MQSVPRYRYISRDDGDGFQIERRVDIKVGGVWTDYVWEDTGDSCDTEEEARETVARCIEAPQWP